MSSVFLSSCAYMQTHKNIEEAFREHTGYRISPNLELFRAGGNYYLAVEKQQVRIHYPAIYDSIFLDGNNEPELKTIDNTHTKVYRQISKGTAEVLQRHDGYADLAVLSDELKNNPYSWESHQPPGSRSCALSAHINGNTVTWIDNETTPEAPIAARLLSTTDRVLIDWPGTVLYNVSIPIMAPFVFFYEFLNEQ